MDINVKIDDGYKLKIKYLQKFKIYNTNNLSLHLVQKEDLKIYRTISTKNNKAFNSWFVKRDKIV